LDRDCCNQTCDNKIYTKRVRCSRCRSTKKHNCIMCNTQVSSASKLYCLFCLKSKEWMQNIKTKPYMECLFCEKQLTGNQRKYCSHTCWYKYSRVNKPKLRRFFGRRQLNQSPKKVCQICGKISYRMGRSLCDGPCATAYHRYGMRRFRNKNT
jgi:hypothetical protein